MTATLEALAQRRGEPSPAVMTSDGAAWSWPDLFAQFAPDLRSFARSRGSASPEDVVQDVFITAVERLPRFDGDSSGLRSFLFTLAYRRVADEHRARYRRPEQLVADHHPTVDHGADIEQAITAQEDAGEALKALEILNGRERRIIEMRIVEEATPAQVAERLGLSNGNVRVIQARALMKIRKYLTAKSGTVHSIGLVLAFLKGLRSKLPSDGGLTAWIEMLRSEHAQDSLKTGAAGAGSAIAAEAASAATAGTIAGTLLKMGLVVAVATTSASLAETASATDRQPEDSRHASQTVATDSFGTPPETAAAIPPAAVNIDSPVSEPDTPAVPGTNPALQAPLTQPETTGSPQSEDSLLDDGPDGESTPLADDLEPLIEEVVEPLVGAVVDTVDTVVDDVVEPLVEVVIEDVVEPVVEDVVQPIVEEVVVEGVVEAVVDDVVAPVVDETTQTVNDTVDTVVDGVEQVSQPLGGLLGQ